MSERLENQSMASEIGKVLDNLKQALNDLCIFRHRMTEEAQFRKAEVLLPRLFSVSHILGNTADEITVVANNIRDEIEELRTILF